MGWKRLARGKMSESISWTGNPYQKTKTAQLRVLLFPSTIADIMQPRGKRTDDPLPWEASMPISPSQDAAYTPLPWLHQHWKTGLDPQAAFICTFLGLSMHSIIFSRNIRPGPWSPVCGWRKVMGCRPDCTCYVVILHCQFKLVYQNLVNDYEITCFCCNLVRCVWGLCIP